MCTTVAYRNINVTISWYAKESNVSLSLSTHSNGTVVVWVSICNLNLHNENFYETCFWVKNTNLFKNLIYMNQSDAIIIKGRKMGKVCCMHTLIQRFPVQMICWIFPGTSIDLNFAGKSGDLWGMWRSPRASTSTILVSDTVQPQALVVIIKIYKQKKQ